MKWLNPRLLLLFVVDILIILSAYYIAMLLITNFHVHDESIIRILENLYWIIPIYVFSFVIFSLYKSLWRYASVEEALNVFLSVFISFGLISLVNALFHVKLPTNVIIIANIIIFLGLIGFRFSFRTLRVVHHYWQHNQTVRTLIIGAGNAGTMLVKEIKSNPKMKNKVVCFVDDDVNKKGKVIHGIKVVGTTDDLPEVVNKYRVEEIILAMPSATKMQIQRILKKCDVVNKKTKILPPFYEIMDRTFDVKKIRDVQIEDLLGRDEVKIDDAGIYDFIKGEVVLVTGGGGSIGSELCRQIVKYEPAKLIIFDIYENNAYEIQNELLMHQLKNNKTTELIVLIGSVQDEKRLDEVFSKHKPTIVFHAAAHKHVPLMEVSPKEAIKNNIFGTYNTAKKAHEYKVKKFVLISSDKAVNPTNIMGATKRFAEMIIQAFNKVSNTQYAAVRFGNVLGSNGSVIPLFKKQIQEGGPVTVTHKDIIRYFMTIPEAVQLVLQAGAFANGGEIFVLDMGEPVRILELAEKLIRLSGYEPYTDIKIEFTGLRPGEKLYEELLVKEEGLIGTRNDKIFVSHVNGIDIKQIEEELHEMKQLIDNDDIVIQDVFSKYVCSYRKESCN